MAPSPSSRSLAQHKFDYFNNQRDPTPFPITVNFGFFDEDQEL
jgi:hypothetical protein